MARPTSPASGRSTGGMRQGASSPPPCRRPQGRNARFPGRHGPLCSPRISSPAPPRASCRPSAGSRRCHLSTRRSSGKAPPSGTGGMPHPRLAGPPRRHCSPRWPCGAFLRGCRGIVGQLLFRGAPSAGRQVSGQKPCFRSASRAYPSWKLSIRRPSRATESESVLVRTLPRRS